MFRFKVSQWFDSYSTPYVAVKVDSTTLKALSLSTDKPVPSVLSYAEIELPSGVYDGSSIQHPVIFSQCLRSLFLSLDINHPKPMLSLSDSLVMMKVVQLGEGLNEQEMEDIIAFESRHYFSYPIETLYVDFKVLGPSKNQINQVDVALVATRKEHVDGWIEVFDKAGYALQVMDVDVYCFERLLPFVLPIERHHDNKVTLWMDVVEGGMRLYAFLEGKVFFSHEERGELHVFSEPGEKAEDIISQLNRALTLFSAHQRVQMGCFYLSGEGTLIARLAGLIEAQFNIVTYLANPFQAMTFATSINKETLLNSASTWVGVCGLALRHKKDEHMTGINLLPWRSFWKKQKTSQLNAWLYFSIWFGSAVSMIIYLYATAYMKEVDEAVVYLGSEIKACDRSLVEVNQLQDAKAILLSKLNQVLVLESTRSLVPHFFDELAHLFPDELYLTAIQRVQNQMTLRGVSRSNRPVVHLLHQIENNAWMSQAMLTEIKEDRDLPHEPSFQLTFTLQEMKPS